MAQRLIVEIIGDASSLNRTFRQVERQTNTFGSKMKRAARIGVFAGAAAGVAGLTAAFRSGFKEMAESQKVMAQTAAALKSTGRVAGVTGTQIEQLAQSIQRYSGADDEAVQSAENLLLTFTNIRNQAGAGNDIFTQTTKAVVDLSQAFDQDLSTSAIQLGKALNDPVRGITALRRIGIGFSDSQVTVIRRLTETGRVLEAQQLILKEVNRQVGGSARAYGQTLPGQLKIAQGSLENLAGALAQQVNPQLEKLTKQFNKWLENPEHKRQIIEGFATAIHGIGVAFRFAADGARFLQRSWNFLEKLGGTWDLPNALGDFRPGGKVGGGGNFPVPGAAAGGGGGGRRPLATLRVPPPAGASIEQRNTWFDAMINRMLGRVGDVGLRDQIGRLNEIARLLQQRLAATKDVTRRLTLEDQILDVLQQRRSTQAALSDEMRSRAEDAKEAARAAREAALETQRGWLDFAVERAEVTKTIKDDVKAYRAVEAAIKERIRQEGRTLDLVRDLWRTRQAIRDLNKRESDKDPMAGLMQVSSRRLANILAAGTGLGLTGRHRLLANIAGAEIQPLTIPVMIDGREVGRATTRHQTRSAHRTARQTSGRRE